MLADPTLDVFFVCASVGRGEESCVGVIDTWRWLKHYFGASAADRLVSTADKTLLLNNHGAILVSADTVLVGRYASSYRGERILFDRASPVCTAPTSETKQVNAEAVHGASSAAVAATASSVGVHRPIHAPRRWWWGERQHGSIR